MADRSERELFEAGFRAGFDANGEGSNGETPGDHNDKPGYAEEIDRAWERFDRPRREALVRAEFARLLAAEGARWMEDRIMAAAASDR